MGPSAIFWAAVGLSTSMYRGNWGNGPAEEIARELLYLVSDEAAFITGTALIIDGGWSAGLSWPDQ